MKAQEIRFGNLVNKNGVPTRIGLWDFNLIINGNGRSKYTPIPISEKILLDFGFTEVLNGFYTHAIVLRRCERGGLFFDYSGGNETKCVELTYVHQLQNLYFALTGEELQL